MRYLMTIQYDGTAFHGWQVQPNGITVQETVGDAFEQFLGHRLKITGCSRTDSGVHALKFCFHFDYDGKIPSDRLVFALNAHLPSDISAIDCRQVPNDFHARYSVLSKRYVYKIYNAKIRSPFFEGRAYHFNMPLDEKIMDEAAKQFIGTYDFSAFCSANSSVEDKVRTVYDTGVKRNGDVVEFYVEANGFLYNMVRIMAGTLISCGVGKLKPSDIIPIIQSKKRNLAGVTAPPQGLYLYDVKYDFSE